MLFITGDLIGKGMSGSIYQHKIFSNQVVKSALFCPSYDIEVAYLNLSKALQYIRRFGPSAYTYLYEYEIIEKNDVGIKYHYSCEKLLEISDDEVKLFHTLISHEDKNLTKNLSKDITDQTINELHLYLNFNKTKAIEFLTNLVKAEKEIKHNDLHPRNIMKDKNNNYFLIDFETCILKEKNEIQNN